MEKPEILLSCSYGDIEAAKLAANSLQKEGVLASVTTCAINLQKVIGVVLTSKTEEERLVKENPWIQKEFAHSDETRLRVLPFIIFDSRKESLDTLWEQKVEAIYEHLFSDEFKPLAYDLAKPIDSAKELLRVLQLYYVK
jgi:ssDNA-binding replication factor A large subunit